MWVTTSLFKISGAPWEYESNTWVLHGLLPGTTLHNPLPGATLRFPLLIGTTLHNTLPGARQIGLLTYDCSGILLRWSTTSFHHSVPYMVHYSVHYSVLHSTAHDLVSFKLDYWPHTTAGSESRTSDNVRFQHLLKKCCDYLTKSLNTTPLSLTFFTTYNARKKIIQCTIYSSDDCNECQLQNSSPAVGLLVYQPCWLWLFFSNIYYYLYLIDVNNLIWGNFWVLFNPFVMQYFVSCTKWYNYVKSTIYPVCVHTVYCSSLWFDVQTILHL